MKIYVRKILNHDITHEVSVTTSIVREFFDGKTSFDMIGKKSNEKGVVIINSATDPRFGGDFKQLLRKEGDVSEGDIVLIYKYQNHYVVDIITKQDAKYESIMELCKEDKRHTLLYGKKETVIDMADEELSNKYRFKKWLIEKNYSESSSIQYANHVNLASKEALNKGIIEKNIYEISDIDLLNNSIQLIKQMDEYINRKNNGNGINEAALNLYIDFFEENMNFDIEENNDFEDYSKEKFLEEVFIDSDKYDSIVSILNKKKNIILEGAPGVGKTFMAKRLAYSIIGKKDENKVKLIQFHQSYSYEDFVEGYRPKDNGFKLEQGIFYKLCKKAEEKPEEDYYLIIDEINRGNLSKIFGELLMLIESDKRGESLNLAYSEKNFKVPENLYIIGLMNTADRSLALIDYALRRRFSFIRIEPAFESEKFIKSFNDKFDNNFNDVIEIIKKINEAIEQDKSLGAGFKIGHSYFCPNLKDRKGNKKDIEDIIKYEILPLLEEYWYDDPDSIIQWKDTLNGVIND